MKIITAPDPWPETDDFMVFLAGSIDQGKALNWQNQVSKFLTNVDGYILNPRREDWDDSWEQVRGPNPFTCQVYWELEALERADMILMHFEPGMKSPISLLEFGLYAKSDKLVVHCPQGFWRKGNIDITACHHHVLQVSTLEQLGQTAQIAALNHYLEQNIGPVD